MGERSSRTGEIVGLIRGRIASSALAKGDRLPSIRKFAASLTVSPSTVVEAYDRLVSEGVVVARPGSGFYVAGAPATLAVNDLPSRADRAIDPLWVSRQSLDASPQTLRPGCGWLPAAWMPNTTVRSALRAVARADDALLADYGPSRGLPDLRQLLARRCAGEGVEVSPDQVLLTSSGTQAVDLICRYMLRPGDTVLIDDPCYFNFQALLEAHRVRIVSVPFTPSGPDMAVFAAVLAQEQPRLYITNSAIHNPTGATMTAQTVHRLLSVATAHGLVIVEDEIFADFEPEPSPRLAVFDGLNNVIRIGSFSKTLSASIRCGYVIARPEWIEGMIDLQVATNFCGVSPIAAQVVFTSLMDSGYRRHLEALRRRLSKSRREVAARLANLGIQTWVTPRGGFYLWAQLPDEADASQIAQAGLGQGVVFAPGNVFSASQQAGAFMRFNVAQMEGDRALDVLKAALTKVRD